ncbi:MAG: hypothetical protein EOM34_13820 [Clostridia bacterium]|nr:hypothetical protein [Clostridia bacterium]NCC99917.1 hypothetical protein [Bacteroidia bacterium]
MYNAIIVGFDESFIRDVIYNLERGNCISIKKWFVSCKTIKEQAISPNMINWRTIYEEFNVDTLTEYCPKKIYDEVYKKIPVFYTNLVRESYFSNRSVDDCLNVINMYIHYLYFIINKNKVNYIVFSDAPHGAYAPILYYLAKAMNIKTLILFPCYMRDKFLFCYDLEDIGYFSLNNAYTYASKQKFAIEEKYEKDVFWEPQKTIRQRYRLFFNFTSWLEERKSILKHKKKYDGFYDYTCSHIVKFVLRTYNEFSYQKLNNSVFKHEVNAKEKYVYFPLHLQPEMTTAILGGIYNDQLLAIERISEIIADDWVIYVKENPLQTYYMRGEFFYKRLCSNKKVRCIKNDYNTYALINGCEFVATITGTVGWEAISGGKAVLVFGKAWYRGLPGVINYSDNITIEDICNHKIAHNLVVEEFNKLQSNFVEGVIDGDVAQYMPDLSFSKNRQKVEKFLEWAINEGCNKN